MPPQSVSREVTLKSAVLIQKWFRRYRARMDIKRRIAWVVYQSIEYSSEASQLHLYGFFNDLLRLQQDESPSLASLNTFAERLQKFGDRDDRSLLTDTSFEDIGVESSYSGPHLSFPLSATHVQLMMDSFRRGERLHAKYLLQLLHETRLLLKTLPNIYQVSSSISKQVTVVGDLHGQLDDLLVVFYKNGLPDVTNPYVFNGDFVDRGANSVEVAALLFACLLVWPTAVFVNRGNHEDETISKAYGFMKELLTKYSRYANRLWNLCCDLFTWLPLATIIDNRILVTHGGVSDKLDLSIVRRLERHRYASPASLVNKFDASVNRQELEQILGLLWSDPQPQRGCQFNKARGGGSLFGPDVTAGFLRRHGLAMIVRSHEAVLDGYQFCHKDTVLTVFSASNYSCDGSNKGAYAKFDHSGKLQIVQYVASKETKKPPMSKIVSSMEEGALRSLRAKIAASKIELLRAFERCDPDKTGSVTVAEWAKAMKATLQLDLPWRTLRPQLAQLGKYSRVMYMSTFQRVAIQNRLGSGKADATSSSITEMLYKNKEELEMIFRIMDKDNSGHISIAEFKECCRILCRATQRRMSEEEVANMAKMLDLNSDGNIDFNEFLEAFRIVDFQQQQPSYQKRT